MGTAKRILALKDAEFDGDDYQPDRDKERLTGQIKRVFRHIQDGKWYTVEKIANTTGDPQTSVSAQIRNLRKPKFGAHEIDRQYLGSGLYEYRMIAPTPTEQSDMAKTNGHVMSDNKCKQCGVSQSEAERSKCKPKGDQFSMPFALEKTHKNPWDGI